jgi:alpha-L-rhamnosidase
MLCDLGFSVKAGQRAAFWDVAVKNNRAPHASLFREDLSGPRYAGIYAAAASEPGSGLRVEGGRYRLDGGRAGAFVVADPSRNSTPMLRTEFKARSVPLRDARLYVTARGIYEVHLNGSRVGEDRFTPGLTQYDKTHMYQTYDVTKMIRSGENALAAMLGEGWWSGLLSFGSIWNHFGDRQSLLARLVIRYRDGSTDVVTSNPRDWKTFSGGPVVYGSLDMGEVYDARKEAGIRGWTTAGFDDRAWMPAREVPLAGTAFLGKMTDRLGRSADLAYDRMSLVGQVGANPGVYQTLTARSVREVRDGVFVYDMGQNFVGVPRITFANGKAGRRVVLRVAEMLYPDLPESSKNVGMIMTENYRAALCQDVYVMRDGEQVFEPRFTFRGYRYLEITGIPEALPASAVQGVAISSIRGLTAAYETSNPRVNQLWSNLVWSNVGNFLSIPTDCPQRNERMGWSGDISVFSRTATYVSDADPFLTRHMRAMRDVQSGAGRFADIAPVGGLRGRPLGQRRDHRALGGLPAVRRPAAARGALPGHGGLRRLPGDDQGRGRPRLRQRARRLARAAERPARVRLPRDRLSRVRPRDHGEDGRDPRPGRRRPEVPADARGAPRLLQRAVRERRRKDGGARRPPAGLRRPAGDARGVEGRRHPVLLRGGAGAPGRERREPPRHGAPPRGDSRAGERR